MIWDLVRYTGMSKNQVLEEIYPDEVPDLLKKANIERARQRQKELTGYFYTLMAPVLPWMKDEDGFKKELIESITGELQQIQDYLQSKKQSKETGQQPEEDPFEKLKRLQGIIASTQAKKAR